MNPAPMPWITALYAGLLGILVVVLGARVTLLRRSLSVGMGDGGHESLARAIRVHANAIEWMTPALMLLLVAELNRASPLLLHICGAVIVFSRVAHALGMGRTSGVSLGRFLGAGASFTVVLALAVWNLVAFARVFLR